MSILGRTATNPTRPRRGVVPTTATPIVTVAAVIGAFLGAHPTGLAVADVVVTAATVGLITWAAARARRWAWIVLAGAAVAVAGPPWALLLAGIAVLGASASALFDKRHDVLGAAVGALSAIAMLAGTELSTRNAALVSFGAVGALLVSAYGASRSARRTARRTFLAATLVGGSAIALYAVALAQAKPSIDQGLANLDLALAAGRDGNTESATSGFNDAAASLQAAHQSLTARWSVPVKFLPGIGPNVKALDELVLTATWLADEAATTAQLTDLKSVTVAGGRLDVASVKALHAPLKRVSEVLDESVKRLAAVRTSWLVSPVRSRLTAARDLVGQAAPSAQLARDSVLAIPDALGATTPRRYLVLFVTPAEARGRIGFIGNFAEVMAVDGKLTMTRFGRTTDLQSAGVPLDQRVLTGPDDYLKRYERFGVAYTWQNITMAADFPSVAEVARQLYPQSGGRAVDGVIALDPVGLAALLEFTGPVTVAGVKEPLTSETVAQFLLRDQYVLFTDSAARVDALETIARTTFTRLNQLNVSSPKRLLDRFGAAAGHIHVETFKATTRSVVRRAGLRGELARTPGRDFLAVTSSNMGGSKIDVFLRREIDYKVSVKDGRLEAELTVNLQNDAPASGLPAYVIGNVVKQLLPGSAKVASGVNRSFLSLYTPWQVESMSVDGVRQTPEIGRERGLNVASTFLDIPPGGQRTVRLRLTGQMSNRCGYNLDIATQPLPILDSLTVRNGATKPIKLTLDRDHVTLFTPRCSDNARR